MKSSFLYKVLLAARVPAGFGLIAAGLHITPATAMILTGIEKQPLTIISCAGSHIVQFFGCQKISRRRNLAK